MKGVGHREVEEKQEEQKGHPLKAVIEVDRLQERESGDEQQGGEGGDQSWQGEEGATAPSPQPEERRDRCQEPEEGPLQGCGGKNRIRQGDGRDQNPEGDL
jgi:hypothetical protein